MSKIRHWKYLHPQITFPKLREIKGFQGTVKFNEGAIYNTGTEQEDWNKLIGIKCSFFGQMKESAMIGWRWNLEGYVELVPYFHFTGNEGFTDYLWSMGLQSVGTENAFIMPSRITRVNLNEEASIKIELLPADDAYFVSIVGSTDVIKHDTAFYEGYKISGWMGGQEPAQKSFHIESNITYL